MKKRQDVTAFAYDRRGRLIAVGKNSHVKTHPMQAKIAARVGLPKKIFLHAEMDALVKARGRRIHKLVVVRVDSAGRYACAKPCAVCAEAIRMARIEHVSHT